jgi:predicted 3-demethylubiquinone-9 3-methyltransferase (glyoxalase superfamily)
LQPIVPCLWFDGLAEEAARFYVSTFRDGRIIAVTHYPEGASGPADSVMTVHFSVFGQTFMALNGGPGFRFTQAVSLMVACATQAELDATWERLGDGGEPLGCGWIKDRFGLSWQVIPAALEGMLTSGDAEAINRTLQALWQMTKLDAAELERAFKG